MEVHAELPKGSVQKAGAWLLAPKPVKPSQQSLLLHVIGTLPQNLKLIPRFSEAAVHLASQNLGQQILCTHSF